MKKETKRNEEMVRNHDGFLVCRRIVVPIFHLSMTDRARRNLTKGISIYIRQATFPSSAHQYGAFFSPLQRLLFSQTNMMQTDEDSHSHDSRSCPLGGGSKRRHGVVGFG